MALRKLLGDQVELPREAPEINCTGQSSQLTLPSADLKVVYGSKRYCRQMNSCEEARAFLSQCGLSRLDSDKDGVPCEALYDCRGNFPAVFMAVEFLSLNLRSSSRL